MHPTLVSLIICTRNRASSLERCLDSILRIRSAHPWELVVVDNGSSDSTAQVVKSFMAKTEILTHYVFEPTKGLSRARNAGIAAASGDPILFTDDDCYPDPDFIDAAIYVFQTHQVHYFGGRIMLHDPDDYPITINTTMSSELWPPTSFIPAGIIQGANMGFRREIFERIGGFNELLGAGAALLSGEDVELVGRASAAGFSGGYFPEPAVSHHHGRKAKDIPRLRRGYEIGRGAYYASMILSSSVPATYAKNWYWSNFFPNYTIARKFRLVLGGVGYALAFFYRKLRRRPAIPVWPMKASHVRQHRNGQVREIKV